MALLKNTVKVSVLTLLSRVLGMLRDGVFSRYFGAGAHFDVFLIAFKIPQFMRRIFAEGAFSQAFIPMLKDFEAHHPNALASYLDRVFTFLCLGGGLVTLSALLCPQAWIMLFAAGIVGDAARYAQALEMVRWIFPCVMCIAIGGFFAAALQSKDRFSVPALVPAMQNVVFIASACVSVYAERPIFCLVWGLLVASVLQVVWLWWQYRLIYGPLTLCFEWSEGMRRTLSQMWLGMYATSTNQISVVVDSMLLSFLPAGSMSFFYFAERICYLPQGLFGVSICTVLSPALAKAHNEGNDKVFLEQLEWAIFATCLFNIPAAFGLYCYADAIVATLYMGGKFGVLAVESTASLLRVLAFGVPVFPLQKIFVTAYAAKRRMDYPATAATVALCVNVVVSVLLIRRFEAMAVALAMCLSSYVNVGLLWSRLYDSKVRVCTASLGWNLGKIGLACSSVVLSRGFVPSLALWAKLPMHLQLAYLSSSIVSAVLLYGVMLWGLSVPVNQLRRF